MIHGNALAFEIWAALVMAKLQEDARTLAPQNAAAKTVERLTVQARLNMGLVWHDASLGHSVDVILKML